MTNMSKAVYTAGIGTMLFLITFAVAFLYDQTSLNNVTALEGFAVWSSYVCTIMVVAGMRLNFIFAVVTTGAYSALAYQNNLFASAGLNAYLVPMAIAGWFLWGREDTRRVTSIFHKPNIPLIAALAGICLLIYGATSQFVAYLGGVMPREDSAILILTIVAQMMMSFRKLECWIVWTAVNVIAIVVYAEADLILVALQYWYFLFNGIFAFYWWNRNRVDGTVLT